MVKKVHYIFLTLTCLDIQAQVAILPSFQASHFKPPAYPNNLVANGLILKLDASDAGSYSGSGTTWYDLSGQGAHATLINGTAWVSNGTSSYFNFDGVDDLAVCGTSQSYRDVMIVMWSGGITGVDQSEMIFVTGTASDFSFRTTAGYFRHMDPYPPNAQDWNGSGMENRDFVNGTFISSNPSLIGSWNIVRVCRSGGGLCLYNLSTNFIINPACSYRGYKGRIAIVLSYNRELTQSEVLQNYNFLKSRFGL